MPVVEGSVSRIRSLRALDWLNFFLADLRGGMGAYVNVYLFAHAGWDPETLGAVLTISGLVGITLHAPIGALIDRTTAKRAMIFASAVALGVAAMAIAYVPSVPVVFAADVLMAVLGAVLAPTIAAITLGLVGRDELARRLGRNAVFDRIGNLFIAVLVGIAGTYVSPRAPFFLVPLFAGLTSIALGLIPARDIDHARARGLEPGEAERDAEPVPWRRLLAFRPLIILCAAITLFHFANAPILALLGQQFALQHPGDEIGLTSAAIVVSQLATIAAALLVTRADVIGRKPLLLLACAALPLRALLCAVATGPWAIVAIQVLDGVGGGLIDALLPLVLADIMRGSGHYSAARGLVGFMQGIGGSLAQVVAGTLVVHAGYSATFLALAALALLPLGLVAAAVHESAPKRSRPAAGP